MSEDWTQVVVVWCLAVVSVARARKAPGGRVARSAAVTRAEAKETQTSPAAESCGH